MHQIALILLLLIFPSVKTDTLIREVDATTFKQLVDLKNGILLDVRTRHEFKNGHITHSGNINFYATNFKKRLLRLPKGRPVYLYCNTGYRSKIAAKYLVKNGYTEVYNLQHGIMEWDLANLPIVIEPGAHPETDNKMNYREYQALIHSDSLVFIDFYAPWCGPCRKMMPMIDSLKVQYFRNIKFVKVNADASRNLMKSLKLIGVPYLELYFKGKRLYKNSGLTGREALTLAFDRAINRYGIRDSISPEK